MSWGKSRYSKRERVCIGGKAFTTRSSWEKRYAEYLEAQKDAGKIHDWHYEPFRYYFPGIKRGCVSYLPDFIVEETREHSYVVEVKGYMDSKSKTRLKRMAKYHPSVKIVIVGKEWFKK